LVKVGSATALRARAAVAGDFSVELRQAAGALHQSGGHLAELARRLEASFSLVFCDRIACGFERALVVDEARTDNCRALLEFVVPQAVEVALQSLDQGNTMLPRDFGVAVAHLDVDERRLVDELDPRGNERG
jgi:hypothetical protein